MISDLCICLSKCHTNSLRLKQYRLVHVYSDIILIRFGISLFGEGGCIRLIFMSLIYNRQ